MQLFQTGGELIFALLNVVSEYHMHELHQHSLNHLKVLHNKLQFVYGGVADCSTGS